MTEQILLKTFMDPDEYEILCKDAEELGVSPNRLLRLIVTEYVRAGKWRSDYDSQLFRAVASDIPEEDSSPQETSS